MSGEVLSRVLATDLDVIGDGRTIVGTVAPYDRVAVVNDGFGPYREAFARGAFDKVMRGRPTFVRLHLEHGDNWVGRGERWLDTPTGLSMAFRLDDTEAGRTAAYKVRDGQTPCLSVHFTPGRTVTRMTAEGPVEVRATVRALHHVALVPQGAYDDAVVTSVRSASSDRVALWQAWLDSQRRDHR